MSVFREYLSAIQRSLAQGDSTEHTHRPAFKDLLESFGNGIIATNEPRRTQCGAPDFKISRAGVPLGHIETKDVGTDLSEIERGRGPHAEQFLRYKTGLPNWILTNYLDFHWFVNGQRRLTASLARVSANGKLTPGRDGETEVAQLIDAFLKQEAFTIGTARDLAQHMAHMTRLVRDQIVRAFDQEKEKGWLHTWLGAFREVLIPDLDEPKFADMFAQTLSYGLFAARVHTLNHKDFSREKAAYALPKTNPFLRKLFSEIAGVDMPETIEWAVNDLVELLRHAAMREILKDFGKAKGKEDPVVHFYETFLSAYDPKMRELRGVYYTPEPVVSYIVRSVDHLLKTRFSRPKGLADENTLILDPAVGTATFLYFVVQHIYEQFADQKGSWDDYVSSHLLSRIFGFELLMAPYAIAHLKLGMQLQETGYKFASDQRLGIYLTNTLEEAAKKSEQLFARFISDEANAAAEIKRDVPIMVVLGNPPYSVASQNKGSWIQDLLSDYKKGLNEKKLNLDDDFIKFIRFAQWRIERTGHGILAFISNNTYLDGITHRRMRECLLESFNDIFIYNLHGSAKKQEVAPDGSKDDNVFDIMQGVAIGIFIKEPGKSSVSIHHADLWGSREGKYETLFAGDSGVTKWTTLEPSPPHFFFVPKEFGRQGEYEKGWRVGDVFKVWQNGLKTDRDELFFDFDKAALSQRMEMFFSSEPEPGFEERYRVEASSSYDIRARREQTQLDLDNIRRCLYRPFDFRWLYYDPLLTSRPAEKVMRHMLPGKNLAMICLRQSRRGEAGTFLAARDLINKDAVSLFDIATVLPLYLYESEDRAQRTLQTEKQQRANLSDEFVRNVTQALNVKWTVTGGGGLPEILGPDDVFYYAYSIFSRI